jgi:hypothetical protein
VPALQQKVLDDSEALVAKVNQFATEWPSSSANNPAAGDAA